ncbi:MAG: TonB-dependent receptor [Candidatus Kapaibacterium sp.]
MSFRSYALLRLGLFFVLTFSTSSLLRAQTTVTLSGVITDKESGDEIPGATVLIYAPSDDSLKATVRGAAANAYGFYSIPSVSVGTYLLVVRAIGYQEYRQKIEAQPRSLRYDVAVTPTDVEGEGVTVIGDRSGEPETRSIGRVELPVEYLQRLPMLGGESDILRTLQLMPGVQQISEISSGLYVRGGSPDQNLTLLDEVVIYNPSHLAGFLSTFNSDAIKDISLTKGAFPAKYGGRLSSVLDLKMREGTKEDFSGAGGISLISSRLTVEGPISDKSTFMLSGRRFYLDILKNLLPDENDAPDYYFYDLNGKVNYQLSDKDKLYLSGYHGRDVVTFNGDGEEVDVNWGNSTANLRWGRIISPSAFSNVSLSWTRYGFDAAISDRDPKFEVTDEFVTSTGIRDLRLKGNLQLFPHPDHIIETGIEGTRHDSRVRALALSYSDTTYNIPDSLGLQNANAYEVSIYGQDEWKATDRLSLNLGGRVTWFEKGNYFYAEPRVSAVYRLNNRLSLTGAYAEARQPVHLVIRNGISLPTDTWFPATETIKPGKSWQGSLGVMGTLGEEWEWSLEGYYKSLENLYEYSDTATFNPLVQVEDQLVEGTGEAWGVELFVQKKVGDFTGWIGYTLAETSRTFADLNGGKPFHPRYDRRHDVKVVLLYQLGESWDLGATWVYGTGQAYTVPTGQYTQIDPDFPYQIDDYFTYSTDYRYTARNEFRIPAYHRLDLNFSHTFKWFELPWRLSLNIYNVYNRRNVFSWYITQDYDKVTDEYRPVVKQLTLFPIIPTVGLSFEF